jgi:hypothetical protein
MSLLLKVVAEVIDPVMASSELGAMRSRAGRTDSDRESIGGILDKQSVELGVSKPAARIAGMGINPD